MALTVKQLNSDASFLLSFEPVLPNHSPIDLPKHLATSITPFTILLDPWIAGPSTIFHPKVSFTRLHSPACVTSLAEIPEPDLVVISQHRSDHCNEPTLRQLPGKGSGSKTVILAEPGAAKIIKGWKHFDPERVRALDRWDKSRSRETVTRIPVPPVVEGGMPGEVTVAFITQRRDITGLHGAIGITYRPPGLSPGGGSVLIQKPDPIVTKAQPQSPGPLSNGGTLTPPTTPKVLRSPLSLSSFGNVFLNTPLIPGSARGKRGYASSRPNSSIGIPQVDAAAANANENNTGNGNVLLSLPFTSVRSTTTTTTTTTNDTPSGTSHKSDTTTIVPTDQTSDSPPTTPTWSSPATAILPIPPMPTSPPPPPPIHPGSGVGSIHVHTSPILSPLRAMRSLSTIVSPSPSSPLSNALTAVTSVPTTIPPSACTPPKTPSSPPAVRPPTPFSARTLSTLLTLASRPGALVHGLNRPVSVIFSPHGTSVSALEDFTSTHLIPQAAVPLTLLMHCFDRARNPWFLGGEISLGAQAGATTAARLGARAWVSAHDGEKEVRGVATGLLRIRRWGICEVEGWVEGMERRGERERAGRRERRRDMAVAVSAASAGDGDVVSTTTKGGGLKRWWPRSGRRGKKEDNTPAFASSSSSSSLSSPASPSRDEEAPAVVPASEDDQEDIPIPTTRDNARRRLRTRVMALGVGEEVILTSEGVWDAEATPRRVLSVGDLDLDAISPNRSPSPCPCPGPLRVEKVKTDDCGLEAKVQGLRLCQREVGGDGTRNALV